ncbi:MAG: hypothetical protein M3281_07065 [Chloroflexota bacterium]|nr:hypothetical protein [Chloroflexota bacterium]
MSNEDRKTFRATAEQNESLDQDRLGKPHEEPGELDPRAPSADATDDVMDPRDVDQYTTDPTAAEGALEDQKQ